MAVGGTSPPGGNIGRGFSWRRVRVEEISPDGLTAICQDLDFGTPQNIPVLPLRGKGGFPRPGETWLIDKSFGGYWSFAAVLQWFPPVITGSTDGIPALESLIAGLAEHGIVVDQTVSDRIRATHTHTHPDPQGGSTGVDAL